MGLWGIWTSLGCLLGRVRLRLPAPRRWSVRRIRWGDHHLIRDIWSRRICLRGRGVRIIFGQEKERDRGGSRLMRGRGGFRMGVIRLVLRVMEGHQRIYTRILTRVRTLILLH